MEPLHARVEQGGRVRGILQLGHEALGHRAGVLVVDLVLEARPEVHGDRAELHLDRHLHAPRRQEHRHLDDDVQALVAVGLGGGDVVLHLAHRDVVLLGEQVEQAIRVVREARRHAHAGDVHDPGADAVERGLHALAHDLVDEAVGRLHAAGDVLDRVVVVHELKLIAENAELGLDLAQPELVLQQEALELVAHRAELLRGECRDPLVGEDGEGLRRRVHDPTVAGTHRRMLGVAAPRHPPSVSARAAPGGRSSI